MINSYSPAVSMVLNRFMDMVDREALDTLYSDLNLKSVTEEDISRVLIRSMASHAYFGQPMFDAQNMLFPGWLEYLKLLKG